MRLDYAVHGDTINVPRFAVEAVEGIGKLFTLATLVLNVLYTKERVEVIFHGLNPEDPERKIAAFREIVDSAEGSGVAYEVGRGGRVPGSSSYFQWLHITRS